MAQGQLTTTERHAIASLPAAVSKRRLVVDGDLVGFAADDGEVGDRLILWLRGVEYTTDVVPQEAWIAGEPLYYHPLANAMTRRATDWPAGWAESPKEADATGGDMALFHARRQPGRVLMPLDFDHMTDLGAVGDLSLRTFANSKLITAAKIVHDGNLVPGAATVALGDGSGSNDQILAATALNLLDADRENAIALGAPVELNNVVLRIGGAPITAGLLIVDIEYSDLA